LGLCLQRAGDSAGGLRAVEPGDCRGSHGFQQRERGGQCIVAAALESGFRPSGLSRCVRLTLRRLADQFQALAVGIGGLQAIAKPFTHRGFDAFCIQAQTGQDVVGVTMLGEHIGYP